MAKTIFDNGGYLGYKGAFGKSFALSVGSVGAGASVQGTTSISWTHTVTDEDNCIVAAISAYPNYDDYSGTLWVGTATVDGMPMTLAKSGYRLGVFTAPISSAGTKTITYNIGSGSSLYAAGNSVSFKNGAIGTMTYSGSDSGTHALTATGAVGSILAFFTGQAYDSVAPSTPAAPVTQQFWTRQTGTYCSVGGFTAVVPAGGSVAFSVYTGQYGSTVCVPILGKVAS